MSDHDDTDPLERVLEVYFAQHDRVSSLGIEAAQDLFALRHFDAELAKLVDVEMAVRGDDDAVPLRFEVGATSILVNVMPGLIDVVIDPPPQSADIDLGTESVALELDSGGATTASVVGVARIRAVYDDERHVVTDPFVVPSR